MEYLFDKSTFIFLLILILVTLISSSYKLTTNITTETFGINIILCYILSSSIFTNYLFVLILCISLLIRDEYVFILVYFLIFSSVGIFYSVNWLTLYLNIEILSLVSYGLAASQNKSPLAIEGAIKYFVLGCISSIFLIIGISIIYFNSGSLYLTDYTSLFLYGSILFKIGAAPLHHYLVDVYEGSSEDVIVILTLVQKYVIFLLLFSLHIDSYIFYYSGIFSLLIGALGASYHVLYLSFYKPNHPSP